MAATWHPAHAWAASAPPRSSAISAPARKPPSRRSPRKPGCFDPSASQQAVKAQRALFEPLRAVEGVRLGAVIGAGELDAPASRLSRRREGVTDESLADLASPRLG